MKVSEGYVFPLFSRPIYVPDEVYPIDDELVEFCKNIELHEYENDKNTFDLLKFPSGPFSQPEARTSVNDQVLECPELSGVKEFFEKNLNYYFNELLAVRDDIEIYIVQSWLMKYSKGDSIHVHSHSNSFLSGTFYIQGYEAPISFHNMQDYSFGSLFHFNGTDLKEENILNCEEVAILNQNGKIVFHPSTVQHSVGVYTGEIPRLGISVNTWLHGKIGDKYGRNLLHL